MSSGQLVTSPGGSELTALQKLSLTLAERTRAAAATSTIDFQPNAAGAMPAPQRMAYDDEERTPQQQQPSMPGTAAFTADGHESLSPQPQAAPPSAIPMPMQLQTAAVGVGGGGRQEQQTSTATSGRSSGGLNRSTVPASNAPQQQGAAASSSSFPNPSSSSSATVGTTRTSELRAIRTREQRAAEEREKAARLEGVRAALALRNEMAARHKEKKSNNGIGQNSNNDRHQQHSHSANTSTSHAPSAPSFLKSGSLSKVEDVKAATKPEPPTSRSAAPSMANANNVAAPLKNTAMGSFSRSHSRENAAVAAGPRSNSRSRSGSATMRRPDPPTTKTAVQGPPRLLTAQRSASAARRGEGGEDHTQHDNRILSRPSQEREEEALPINYEGQQRAALVGSSMSASSHGNGQKAGGGGGTVRHPSPFDISAKTLRSVSGGTFGDAPPLQPSSNTTTRRKDKIYGGEGGESAHALLLLQQQQRQQEAEFIKYKTLMEASVLRMRSQLEEQAAVMASHNASSLKKMEEKAFEAERQLLQQQIAIERSEKTALHAQVEAQNDQLTEALSRLKEALSIKDGQLRALAEEKESLLEVLTSAQRESAQLRLQKERYGRQYDQTQAIMAQLEHAVNNSSGGGGGGKGLPPFSSVDSHGEDNTAAIVAALSPQQKNLLAALYKQQRDALTGHYFPRPNVNAMVQTDVTAVKGFRSTAVCREDSLSGASVATQTAFDASALGRNASLEHVMGRGATEHAVLIESARSEAREWQVQAALARKRVEALETQLRAREVSQHDEHGALRACQAALATERDHREEERGRLTAQNESLSAELFEAQQHVKSLLANERAKGGGGGGGGVGVGVGGVGALGSAAMVDRLKMLEDENRELAVQLKAVLQECDDSRAMCATAREDNAKLVAQLHEAVGHLAAVGQRERSRERAAAAVGLSHVDASTTAATVASSQGAFASLSPSAVPASTPTPTMMASGEEHHYRRDEGFHQHPSSSPTLGLPFAPPSPPVTLPTVAPSAPPPPPPRPATATEPPMTNLAAAQIIHTPMPIFEYPSTLSTTAYAGATTSAPQQTPFPFTPLPFSTQAPAVAPQYQPPPPQPSTLPWAGQQLEDRPFASCLSPSSPPLASAAGIAAVVAGSNNNNSNNNTVPLRSMSPPFLPTTAVTFRSHSSSATAGGGGGGGGRFALPPLSQGQHAPPTSSKESETFAMDDTALHGGGLSSRVASSASLKEKKAKHEKKEKKDKEDKKEKKRDKRSKSKVSEVDLAAEDEEGGDATRSGEVDYGSPIDATVCTAAPPSEHGHSPSQYQHKGRQHIDPLAQLSEHSRAVTVDTTHGDGEDYDDDDAVGEGHDSGVDTFAAWMQQGSRFRFGEGSAVVGIEGLPEEEEEEEEDRYSDE